MDTMDNLVAEGIAYVDTGVNEIVHEQPLGQLNDKVYMAVVCDNFVHLPIAIPIQQIFYVGNAVGSVVALPKALVIFNDEQVSMV